VDHRPVPLLKKGGPSQMRSSTAARINACPDTNLTCGAGI
jgi:hypothetical protein